MVEAELRHLRPTGSGQSRSKHTAVEYRSSHQFSISLGLMTSFHVDGGQILVAADKLQTGVDNFACNWRALKVQISSRRAGPGICASLNCLIRTISVFPSAAFRIGRLLTVASWQLIQPDGNGRKNCSLFRLCRLWNWKCSVSHMAQLHCSAHGASDVGESFRRSHSFRVQS